MSNKPIEAAYKYCSDTIALVSTLEEAFLTLGERLKKVRDEQLYLPTYDTFRDFLEECRMKEGTASKLISVYSTFIETYEMSPTEVAAVGWSVLYESIPLIKSKKDAVDVVHELSNRRDKDARDYVREKRSGIDQDKCAHEDVYSIRCCRTCGLKIKDL
jgi:hypothetical protein